MSKRQCEVCKHRKPLPDNPSLEMCSKWDCKFEPDCSKCQQSCNKSGCYYKAERLRDSLNELNQTIADVNEVQELREEKMKHDLEEYGTL